MGPLFFRSIDLASTFISQQHSYQDPRAEGRYPSVRCHIAHRMFTFHEQGFDVVPGVIAAPRRAPLRQENKCFALRFWTASDCEAIHPS